MIQITTLHNVTQNCNIVIFIKISHIKNVTNKTGGDPNKQEIFERNGMGKCPVSFHDR